MLHFVFLLIKQINQQTININQTTVTFTKTNYKNEEFSKLSPTALQAFAKQNKHPLRKENREHRQKTKQFSGYTPQH